MAQFNKEDLLKVAKLSALDLSEKEIENFGQQLNKVINFIEQIKSVDAQSNVEQVKSKNVFREDVVVQSDPSEILNLAPQQQLNYFVVPKILNESKGS